MIVRAKTMRDWMRANFDRDELQGIAEAADAGWGGLTWYQDTIKLYDRFADEIWEMARDDAEDFGSGGALSLIAGFNCADRMDDPDRFKNGMVWYAAERIARELTDF